jgi:hypothetical protein
MHVYVSFPKDDKPANLEKWEAAIAARVPRDRAVIVIIDKIEGRYQVRSAHTGHAGEVGDLSPDGERILRDAELV